MSFSHNPFGHHPFGHGGGISGNAGIQDLAYNLLIGGSTGQMIGYVEQGEAISTRLGLRIYQFIIDSIRREDKHAAFFLKRYLDGPQAVWNQMEDKIQEIKTLWDYENIDGRFLPLLQTIVGWTGKFEQIPAKLDEETLRRLIAVSIPLWQQRGPEEAIEGLLELTTQAQARIWNWFDFRWVLGETGMGVEHQGTDPWIIDGTGGVDEYTSNLRIVDDGNLDHELVKLVVGVMRACGETFEITYLAFMDLFDTDYDTENWDVMLGEMIVSNGTATMDDSSKQELAVINKAGSTLWEDYVAYWRLKGNPISPSGEFGCGFYSDEYALHGYRIALNIAANTLNLYRVVAGSAALIISQSFSAHGTLCPDVYYSIRAQASPEGVQNRLKIYIDADEIINILDNSYVSGALTLWHSADATLVVDEVEMIQLPSSTETVGA